MICIVAYNKCCCNIASTAAETTNKIYCGGALQSFSIFSDFNDSIQTKYAIFWKYYFITVQHNSIVWKQQHHKESAKHHGQFGGYNNSSNNNIKPFYSG